MDGGNKYREGRDNGVIRPYNSEDRRSRYRKDIIDNIGRLMRSFVENEVDDGVKTGGVVGW